MGLRPHRQATIDSSIIYKKFRFFGNFFGDFAFSGYLISYQVGGIMRVSFLRFEPRVEVEKVSSKLSVVHNYGHCGYGVLSSPGTSQQALSLLNSILNQNN